MNKPADGLLREKMVYLFVSKTVGWDGELFSGGFIFLDVGVGRVVFMKMMFKLYNSNLSKRWREPEAMMSDCFSRDYCWGDLIDTFHYSDCWIHGWAFN